jgi:hypothetical protein
MRIVMGMLVAALIGAWSGLTPAVAQCDPSQCTNPNKAKAAKMKAAKAKKAKKPAPEIYMKSAS